MSIQEKQINEQKQLWNLVQSNLVGLLTVFLKLLQFEEAQLNTHQKLQRTALLLNYLLAMEESDLEKYAFLEAIKTVLEKFSSSLPEVPTKAPAGSCDSLCFLVDRWNSKKNERDNGDAERSEIVMFCVSLFLQNVTEKNVKKKKAYLGCFKTQQNRRAELRTLYHPVYRQFSKWMAKQTNEFLDLVTATRLSDQLIAKLRLSYFVLTPIDTDVFISYVTSLLNSSEQEQRKEGIARSLLILTTLTPAELGQLVVSKELAEEQQGICLTKGVYRRCDLLLEGSYCRGRHSLTEEHYETHSHWVDLPLVEVVVTALRAWLESEGQRELKLTQLGDLGKLTGEPPKSLPSQIPSRKHWGATYQRYLGFCALETRVGGSYASLILANEAFNNLHTHFYSSAVISKSQRIYAECMSKLFKSPVNFSEQSELVYHGDEFCVNGSFIKSGLEQLKANVELFLGEINKKENRYAWRKRVKSSEDLKAFYNHFTLYTFAYFALNVALRATSNVSQSVVIDLERSFAVICEKEVTSDRPERYVPLSEEVVQLLAQWKYLRNYMLKRLGIDHEIIPKIPLWVDEQWQDLSTQHLTNALFNGLKIKGDVLRHFMARSLIDNDNPNLAPSVLGHESFRHHSVGHFSLGAIADKDKSTAISKVLHHNGVRNFELVSNSQAMEAEWNHKAPVYDKSLKRYLALVSQVTTDSSWYKRQASSDEEQTLFSFVLEVMAGTCYPISALDVLNAIERHQIPRSTLNLGEGRIYGLRYFEQRALEQNLKGWKELLQAQKKELGTLFDDVKHFQISPKLPAHVDALSRGCIETTNLPHHRIESLISGISQKGNYGTTSSFEWFRLPMSDFSDAALEAEVKEWLAEINRIIPSGRNVAIQIRLVLIDLMSRYISEPSAFQNMIDDLKAQVKNKERIKFCENDFFRILQSMLPEQITNVYAYCWYLTYQKGKGNRKHYAYRTFKRHYSIFKRYLDAHKFLSEGDSHTANVDDYHQRMKSITPKSSYRSLNLWFEAMSVENNEPLPGQRAPSHKQNVSNTMLLQHEYNEALCLIVSSSKLVEGERLDLACQLILMFKVGYRNDEVPNVRLEDVAEGFPFLSLHQHPGYTPKTPAANRTIFTKISFSDQEKIILEQAYNRAVKTGSKYLIAERSDSKHKAMCYKLALLLKNVSGEPSMRLYDARKGYVNYHYLLLNQVYLPSVQRYFSVESHSEMASIRQTWLHANCSPNLRNSSALYALATSTGHKYEKGLMKSYVHTSSLVMATHQKESFELGDSYWCKLLGLIRSTYTATKAIKNSPSRHYQPCNDIEPVINQPTKFEAPIEHRLEQYLKKLEEERSKTVYGINSFSQSLFDLESVGFDFSKKNKAAFTNAGKKRCLAACSQLMSLPFDELRALKESWFLIHHSRDGLASPCYQQYRSKVDNVLSQVGLSRKQVSRRKSEVREAEWSQLICQFGEFCLALLCVVSLDRQ
ncbi:hypothetical protein [Vibrio sp. PNB22_8_1]|uniref:hypothetical protein n=1 Tax=unclassified Vibrio TaxID=2614977 RepID=UPI00406A81DA